MPLILTYKKRSETMSTCMARIRNQSGIADNVPMTYAGRLDPMAEGLVIFLYGDLRYKKDSFLKLSKKYQIELFFGFTTDTHDVLGVPEKKSYSDISIPISMETIKSFQSEGCFIQKFPQFSSRRVFGRPLFQHVLDQTYQGLPQQDHEVEIYHYELLNIRNISRELLISSIIADIQKVSGDFRQSEIVTQWGLLKKDFPEGVIMYSLSIHCSSGFYVRQWVDDFGKFLGVGAVTFSIIRDTIGVFTMSMLNGESYRVFDEHDPLIHKLTI